MFLKYHLNWDEITNVIPVIFNNSLCKSILSKKKKNTVLKYICNVSPFYP